MLANRILNLITAILAWPTVPLLRIPIAIVGIPLAAVGTTFVALVPSMGEMAARASKLVLCGTWPFSLDYWRSLRGIDVPDYERLTRIKYVMWGLRVGPPPDTTSLVAQVISEDGTHIANGIVYLAQTLQAESTLMGEIRQPGIGDVVGPNRELTIRCFSHYNLDSPLSEFPLMEYEVEPDVIKFKLDESALKDGD